MTSINRLNIEGAISASVGRIRNHPFVREATAGRLTRQQAERWIMCAGRESRSFPHILENIIARSSNDAIKCILEKNLADERGNGDPQDAHFMHYLQLLDALRISRESFYAYPERAGIKLSLSLAYNVSMLRREPSVIGYMLINESITPVTYLAAKRAILRYHANAETNFFDMHIAVDEEHVSDLYHAVEALEDGSDEEIRFGIEIGERGMAVLLDEAYGVFDSYSEVA
ncbi:iron-containing redox enzyme family protein [Sorangium sp. So ce341]|uniref:iron-containing redox enzyme family protein n=1 Tax=Sorangium sp. So ce341 TaxID=3133302 RepID=UPI003F616AF1